MAFKRSGVRIPYPPYTISGLMTSGFKMVEGKANVIDVTNEAEMGNDSLKPPTNGVN